MQTYPVVIRLSSASKMPCHSFSLPAEKCITGSMLRLVAGSVCSKCYARKNFYRMPTVRAPRDWNLAVWEQCSKSAEGIAEWVDAMVHSIGKNEKSGFFRWFDSGDIQSLSMLRAIVSIADRLPKIKFWLPTHEGKILAKYLKNGILPENLIVRKSADMLGSIERPIGQALTCSVGADAADGQCIAYRQGGKCLACRACWNPKNKNINYPLH